MSDHILMNCSIYTPNVNSALNCFITLDTLVSLGTFSLVGKKNTN